MKKIVTYVSIASFLLIFTELGCSKSSTSTPAPTNPCAGVTITVTGTTTPTSTPTASNGSIAATASGSAGLTFSLNGGTAQASGTFTGLAAGSYTITAKNSSGCSGTQSFTVTSTPCPAITVTATVTQTASPVATTGSIAAIGAGSTGFTYNINGGAFQASGTFSNLGVGSYTITAKDALGCTGSNSFTVTAAGCATITLTSTPTNTSGPTATNGSIVASATGGLAPYTYSKDGGASFQASGTFNNLATGTYPVVAKDFNGCLSNTASTTVAFTCPTITANASTTNTIKCETNNGMITITASGSSGFMYNLNGGTFQPSNIFTGLGAANYTFSARDGNGCTQSGNTTVSQAPAGSLFLAVKAVLATNCAIPGCHLSPAPQNGLDFTDDCTIVGQGLRIKARAVDANPSQMPPTGPPLSAGDKQKIVDWINAGGKHNN
ncbi:MAG: hypothetical protein IPL84_14615 [Chitinophagaceae bacterium]|nr:hypothetical protein [Chitinophagaceae bacterium]